MGWMEPATSSDRAEPVAAAEDKKTDPDDKSTQSDSDRKDEWTSWRDEIRGEIDDAKCALLELAQRGNADLWEISELRARLHHLRSLLERSLASVSTVEAAPSLQSPDATPVAAQRRDQ